MGKYKQVRFKDEDREVIISDFLGEVRLKFSFTSECLFITQSELKKLIKTLQVFEELEE